MRGRSLHEREEERAGRRRGCCTKVVLGSEVAELPATTAVGVLGGLVAVGAEVNLAGLLVDEVAVAVEAGA